MERAVRWEDRWGRNVVLYITCLSVQNVGFVSRPNLSALIVAGNLKKSNFVKYKSTVANARV